MKNILILIFSLLSITAFGQFRMVGTGSWSTINDSTYQANVSFASDLTGSGYLATAIDSGYFMFTGTQQFYMIDSVWNNTFSSATIRVVERYTTNTSPVGQVMVFQHPTGLNTIPDVPFGSTGATAQLGAAIVTWNANQMSGTGIDLSTGTRTPTTFPINNSNGTGVTIDNATLEGGTNVAGLMTPIEKGQLTQQTIAYSATISANLNNGNRIYVDMTGDAAIAAPSNSVAGEEITYILTANGANRTATFASVVFKEEDGVTDVGAEVITSGSTKAFTFKVGPTVLHRIGGGSDGAAIETNTVPSGGKAGDIAVHTNLGQFYIHDGTAYNTQGFPDGDFAKTASLTTNADLTPNLSTGLRYTWSINGNYNLQNPTFGSTGRKGVIAVTNTAGTASTITTVGGNYVDENYATVSTIVIPASATKYLTFRQATDSGGPVVMLENVTITTASNGLTHIGSNIKLGGSLAENTTITGAGYDLLIPGLDSAYLDVDGLRIDIDGDKLLHFPGVPGANPLNSNMFFGARAGAAAVNTNTGYANTGIGAGALSGLTLDATGGGTTLSRSNTGIGYNAGAAITTGTYNTLVGTSSGSNAPTTSFQNSGFGQHALISATGNENSAFGANAGGFVAAGNAIFGASAVLSGTGSNNSYFGYKSGENATSGSRNAAFGYLALRSTETSDQVAIGANALRTATTATENTVIGAYAGETTTTSVRNVFIGYEAGRNQLTGGNNIAIGATNLKDCGACLQNVAVGNFVLPVNTGALNTAIGHQSMNDNTSGTRNVAAGAVSLAKNTTGSDNLAFGYEAGAENTIGIRNFYGGTNAGKNSVSGNRNTGIGYAALGSIRTSDNVGIGSESGSAVTTAIGITAVGAGAGRYANRNYNISVGFEANSNIVDSAISNVIVIGKGARPTANNQILLGDSNGSYTQLKSRNYAFNIDQTVGAGQDGYALKLNNTSGEIELGVLGILGGGIGLSALGTANQLLRVNAGATALEYFTPSYLTSETNLFTPGGLTNTAFVTHTDNFGFEITGTGAKRLYTTNGTYNNSLIINSTAAVVTGNDGTNTANLNALANGNLVLNSSTGNYLIDTAPDTDTDAAGNVLLRNGSGFVNQVNRAAFEVLTGSGAPVNGTTTAYEVGQIYIDVTNAANPISYYASTKSTDPDAAATGSVWNRLTNSTVLADADGDTKVQVEESTDEDIIRFDAGGSEVATMSSSQMTIVNSGQFPLSVQGGFHSHIVTTSPNGGGNAYIFFENSGDADNSWAIGRSDDGAFELVYDAAQPFSGTDNTITFPTGVTGEVPIMIRGSATLDFPDTAGGASSDLTITVTGAAVGDIVSVGAPALPTNGSYSAIVTATDTVTVRFSNNDLVSSVNPASGTFKVQVYK